MKAGMPPDPIEDATLAAHLFLTAPTLFGGMVLRGASPARDALVSALNDAMASAGKPMRRMPGHIDDERLLGGIDIAASLSAAKSVRQRGLLEETAGGIITIPMAERIEPGIAGRLAQHCDESDAGPALVLLDDAVEADDAPPASLLERCAFHCDLGPSREWQIAPLESADVALNDVARLTDDALVALAATAQALGVSSLRPLIFAELAARAHAALCGQNEVDEADLEAAVRLILAPRATQMPNAEDAPEPPPESPPEPPQESGEDKSDEEQSQPDAPLEEMLVEAATAAIPADLLAMLAQGKAPRRVTGGGTGKRRKSGLRGKPLGARQGMPRGGARLALIDTLRAAVPWQAVRRKERGIEGGADTSDPILMRKEDLRVRRFEDKAARVTIFAVDASGSAAAARLAESKGAVELMLAQAYVTRSEVALIAFRGDSAEVLLPPTRSLTRARRALSELPGGGGTPLAMGLDAARECADTVAAKGRTPSIIVLTDGRPNIGRDGQPGRKQAAEDAMASAAAIARSGFDALVVDISARTGPEGAALADAMNARFLALPRADARQIHNAIERVQPSREAA